MRARLNTTRPMSADIRHELKAHEYKGLELPRIELIY